MKVKLKQASQEDNFIKALGIPMNRFFALNKVCNDACRKYNNKGDRINEIQKEWKPETVEEIFLMGIVFASVEMIIQGQQSGSLTINQAKVMEHIQDDVKKGLW